MLIRIVGGDDGDPNYGVSGKYGAPGWQRKCSPRIKGIMRILMRDSQGMMRIFLRNY